MARLTPGAAVRRCTIRTGVPVPPGAASPTGLYAVVKARTGWPLRVTLFKDLADLWRHPSRAVVECRVNLDP